MKALGITIVTLATTTWAAAVMPCHAQSDADYPQRSIKIIVNVAPGGGVDAASRVIAQKLGERLGQIVIVENRGGGAGNLAGDMVAHAKPDGYTLMASPGATISINDFLFKDLAYKPNELEPVSVLTSVPLALIVRPDFPAKNFAEFIAYAKANSGKLNYASNGIGTAAHLTAELFMLRSGTKMTHVPYKGTTPVLNDIIASHVDVTFIQYSAFYEFYKAGRAKILAVAADKRVAVLPEVPTMEEVGYPGVISSTWNVLSAPPKTPRSILVKLNLAIGAVLAQPDVKAHFAAMQTDVEGGSIDDAKKYVANDREYWKKVITAAGVQPE